MRSHFGRFVPPTGWKMFALLVTALVFIPVGTRAQTAQRPEWKTPWSYAGKLGPDHWGDLSAEYATCKDGKQQSPIDIRSAEKAKLPALRFESVSGPLRIDNNGVTIRVNYPAGTSHDFLVVGGKRYQLVQFHFHHPSEERIDGKRYDMVLHLMYKSSDGKIVGVAVLLKAGGANATIQQIWKHMPATAGPDQVIPGVAVNPGDLLPHDRAYYMYQGSLTGPPCTEGVTWFVLKAPVELSRKQINAFARLFPHDVRPVQPLNGRVVKEGR